MNVEQRVERGRSYTKYTEEEVLKVLSLNGQGWTSAEISLEVGMPPEYVRRIARREIWAHLEVNDEIPF